MQSRQIDINGTSFNVSLSTNSGFWETFQNRKWEEETFNLLREHLKPGSVFLDIGCWEGPFSLYAAALGAIVHAIDADANAILELKEHVSLNPGLIGKIHIHQLALASEDKPVQLFERYKFGDSASSLLERSRDSGKFVMVAGKTFSSFIDEENIREVDFIKMDIEGSEFIVLPDMLEGLRKFSFPALLAAFHAVYLKENYMKNSGWLSRLSRLNPKLSIGLGKLFANGHARKQIQALLDTMKGYNIKNISGRHKNIIDELMNDGTVLFTKT